MGKEGADDARSFVNTMSAQGVQNTTDDEDRRFQERTGRFPQSEVKVGLLTGGIDRPFVFGLAMALASRGVSLATFFL